MAAARMAMSRQRERFWADEESMASLWHQGTIAPRAPKKNITKRYWKNTPKQILVRFNGLGGLGSMREPFEMYTASRMQNIVKTLIP